MGQLCNFCLPENDAEQPLQPPRCATAWASRAARFRRSLRDGEPGALVDGKSVALELNLVIPFNDTQAPKGPGPDTGAHGAPLAATSSPFCVFAGAATGRQRH